MTSNVDFKDLIDAIADANIANAVPVTEAEDTWDYGWANGYNDGIADVLDFVREWVRKNV